MCDFFIALFGGLHYGHKISKEKTEHNQFKAESQVVSQRNQSYMERYFPSPSIEKQMTNFVMSGDNYDEICEMFKPYFVEVLGEDWQNKLYIPHTGCMTKEDIAFFNKLKTPTECYYTGWVYNLLLARAKKVYTVSTEKHYIIADQMSEWREFTINALRTIETELITQGVNDVHFALSGHDAFMPWSVVIEELYPLKSNRCW